MSNIRWTSIYVNNTQEHKAELNARRDLFSKLEKHGLDLLAENHTESASIQAEIDKTAEIQVGIILIIGFRRGETPLAYFIPFLIQLHPLSSLKISCSPSKSQIFADFFPFFR